MGGVFCYYGCDFVGGLCVLFLLLCCFWCVREGEFEVDFGFEFVGEGYFDFDDCVDYFFWCLFDGYFGCDLGCGG